MFKKLVFFTSIACIFFAFCLLLYAQSEKNPEEGSFSIFFMGQKVGYEEYSWQADEDGYLLSVKGRMTKPVRMEIKRLYIWMNKSFIPTRFEFEGSVSGVSQEISSNLAGGRAENVIRVAGQEQQNVVKIKRDAFLLPNPVFSPYMVITKKFGCSLQAPLELSAYIIPQMESPFTLEPDEERPCTLIMKLGPTQVELVADETGILKAVNIPSQDLRVTRDR
jgi:hypothetical protein